MNFLRNKVILSVLLHDSLDSNAKCCDLYLHLDKQSKSWDMKRGGCLRVWVWLQTGKTWRDSDVVSVECALGYIRAV